jgi:anti-anti-sigma factor
MTMKFHLNRQNNALISSPEGRLDYDAAPEFEKELGGLIEQARQETLGLIIDCDQLSYISSAGLRAFLVSARSAKTRGITLVACGLTPAVKEVFDLSGFSKLIPICSTLDEALAHL